MKKFFLTFFVLIINALAVRRDLHVRFLKLQLQILWSRLHGNRIILTPEERKQMLMLGAELEHEVNDSLMIVHCKTYKKWLRDERDGKQPKKVGRPKLLPELVELIIWLAKENLGWGVKRIAGELWKLGERIGDSTIRRVLRREGLYPDRNRSARRQADSTWQNFIKLHMNVIVATDFLCKTVVTPFGLKTAFLIMFIHLESRKVFISPATYAPGEQWVCQQARNVALWLGENGVKQRFIMHDRDTKYTASFDEIFKAAGVEIVKTPVAAPNANAFAESWIGKIKFEALDHFLCFGLKHLDHIAQSYANFHNELRPHQSKNNEPLRFENQPPPERTPNRGTIECQRILGGLLKHYHRKAT
ncbi:MAG: integrase core domain-containing protein [Phycisphaerales bacterium]|nr:integrase core domain-containing protein [Phycisphaerales bacterium]